MMRKNISAFATLAALALSSAFGQSSASYRITDRTFNAGGHPVQGQVMTSMTFKVTLDSIGDGIVAVGLGAPSFRIDASFASAYPPPGEVQGVVFADMQILDWDSEESGGLYNVYRDLVSALPEGEYGTCLQQNLAASTTTDAETPGPGEGWFYLVTAENRLAEEGTKGWDSIGGQRGGTVCP